MWNYNLISMLLIYGRREEKESTVEKVFKKTNNGLKLPKFDQKHKPTDSRSLVNHKQEKSKDIYTKTDYSQSSKTKQAERKNNLSTGKRQFK